MSSDSPSTSVQQDANVVVTTSEFTSSSIVVKKNKKCTSAVWNDFTKFDKEIKTEVDGKEEITMIKMAKCNHCGFKTNANSKYGTTHYKNHLKACPKKKRLISANN